MLCFSCLVQREDDERLSPRLRQIKGISLFHTVNPVTHGEGNPANNLLSGRHDRPATVRTLNNPDFSLLCEKYAL